MKVSLLIASRDRPQPLFRCLESVLAQDYAPLEILLLDDHSRRHDLTTLVRAQFPDAPLRIFRSPEPLGVAVARNFLMERATGDIFWVIDDDACFAGPDCLSLSVRTLEQYPQVGILAAKIVDHQSGQRRLLVPFNQQQRKQRPTLTEETRLVSYYLGGGHALRRQVIERCGGYHPALMFGEEELDLSYRALEAGFDILYLPSLVIHHFPEPSVLTQPGDSRRSELYYHVRNRFFISYRYLPWRYIPSYLSVWLTVYGLRALRSGGVKDFWSGVWHSLGHLKTMERTPLSRRTVRYLQANWGRLWY